MNIKKFPPIITICGSGRFFDIGVKLACEIETNGVIVFWIFDNLYSSANDREFKRRDKANADVLYFHKIRLSDVVFVIDKDKYIGESTEREVVFAESINIPVLYYSRVGSNAEYIARVAKEYNNFSN